MMWWKLLICKIWVLSAFVIHWLYSSGCSPSDVARHWQEWQHRFSILFDEYPYLIDTTPVYCSMTAKIMQIVNMAKFTACFFLSICPFSCCSARMPTLHLLLIIRVGRAASCCRWRRDRTDSRPPWRLCLRLPWRNLFRGVPVIVISSVSWRKFTKLQPKNSHLKRVDEIKVLKAVKLLLCAGL